MVQTPKCPIYELVVILDDDSWKDIFEDSLPRIEFSACDGNIDDSGTQTHIKTLHAEWFEVQPALEQIVGSAQASLQYNPKECLNWGSGWSSYREVLRTGA